jgi:putative transposase
LQRQARSNRGRRRLPEDLVAAVEALGLRRPAPTTAYVHRRVGDIARDRGLPAPSYSAVHAIVAAIDPGLRTLAVDGDTAYRDRFELVYRRSAARPNEQWQADHTVLDVQILDGRGRPARPWLTVILDDYSRAVAGYTPFLGTPTAEQTALALHQAITPQHNRAWPVQGLPDVLYSDHGSDFTSNRLERTW